MILFINANAFAADNSSGYLAYKEPQTSQTLFSASTVAYIVSLFITFIIILGLAYFVSKMLGSRFGNLNSTSNNKVITAIPLGPGRGIYIVQVSSRLLVLGVTEHNISLLQEVTSPDEIKAIMADSGVFSQDEAQIANVFERHLVSLQKITKKFLEKR